ncbi:hypothetical protein [Aureimonas jatrophae]|uniref:Uncharacterized protein n=1 Tax=Aureimonas jatrophae TaxID=1166073 RepID=A0A1H0LGU4_9HYPH|nr:hypothetical protein [Aureimonas jatrophae]MBB3952513.1 hypothetical protein [Aureimonas jatrophae]SDO67352.1 hypothetical protein SAMN05192530_11029 [Aureimonas jatrophae]
MSTPPSGPAGPVALPEFGHAFRDALRLLFILVRGSEPLAAELTTDTQDRVFVGEKRALAIDFWLRYPDYLADELLDIHAETGDPAILAAVRRIFDEDEPSVRTVWMIRWRRGAYDDLQTSLSFLAARRLVTPMRRTIPSGHQNEFLLGPLAETFLSEAVRSQPTLEWYSRQTDLALVVAAARSGSALKDIHYEHAEYAGTPYGTAIPSIRLKVEARLRELDGGSGG